jgi:hypothetical protein
VAESLFADGIAEITASNGVVRIEFFSLAVDRKAPAAAGETPRMQVVPNVIVVLPMAGFVASLTSIENMKQKLLATGVIKQAADKPDLETAN